MPRSLLLLLICSAVGAQDFERLLAHGPVPYLAGPALLLAQGNLTAGDCADLTCGDYDADGRLDLLVGSSYGDLLLYRRLENVFEAPKPMLSAELSFAAGRLSRLQMSPELADLNHDGVPDLLLGAAGDVYFYSRKGGLHPGRILRTESDRTLGQSIGSRHVAPCAFDLDGDGDLDLLLGDEEGRVWWVECRQAEPLRLADPVLLGAGGQQLQAGRRARVCAGDWDADGRYDLLLSDMTGQVLFVRGRREGFAAPQVLLAPPVQTEPGETLTYVCPRLLDVTGDGKPELLLGCRTGFVAIFAREATGPVFQGYLQARNVPLDVGRCAAPTACDWNADGRMDIVSGAEDGLVRLYLGRADGRFEAGQTVVSTAGPIVAKAGTATSGCYSWPRMTDLNGDGVSDLVLGGASGDIEMYLNQGGFRHAGFMRIGGDNIHAQGVSAIALADHDGDGDPDLFVGDFLPPGAQASDPSYTGPRFVLPSGGLSFYENEAPKGMGMPVFLKGVRLAVYIGKRGRTTEDDALDAGVLGPGYIEPLTLTGDRWNFLLGTRAGYYLFMATKPRQYYPAPILPSTDGIPNPLFPPLHSCTAAALNARTSGFQPRGLLCGLADYGFICYYPPDQVPQLNAPVQAP
ncbi:MAG: VCBS repeat-containing protein [Armatimonadetes bacterium]|nr:VCBS repeat-containing protein [Armatimonadota bacterium]